MTQICLKMVRFDLRRRFQLRVSLLRRCIRCFWEKIFMCSLGKPGSYRVLPHGTVTSRAHLSSVDGGFAEEKMVETRPIVRHVDSDDLVALKISVLGDCQTGKTSFLEKYLGNEIEHGKLTEKEGLNLMDKTLFVKGAFISYSIWEVEGDEKYTDHIPIACKDSVAICIMFDLTSRCTLNSVLEWYQKARKWNRTAIPVLIGTKFDDFIQLPIDLQWTIASQARAYAKALNATLFFSSATYNININKVFKFITAKLFDVPWTLERNLTIGEPIIDF